MRGAAGMTSFSLYGIVYRGRHCELDVPVAVRVCLDHASAERFHREVKLLASVRIATIHGSKKSEILGRAFGGKSFNQEESFRIVRASSDGTLSEDMIKAAFKGINRC